MHTVSTSKSNQPFAKNPRLKEHGLSIKMGPLPARDFLPLQPLPLHPHHRRTAPISMMLASPLPQNPFALPGRALGLSAEPIEVGIIKDASTRCRGPSVRASEAFAPAKFLLYDIHSRIQFHENCFPTSLKLNKERPLRRLPEAQTNGGVGDIIITF